MKSDSKYLCLICYCVIFRNFFFFILTLLSFHLALLPADGLILCNVHLPLFLPSSQPLFLCVSHFISSLRVFSWDIAYNLFHSAQLDFTAVPQVKA